MCPYFRLQIIHKRLKLTDELLGDMLSGAERIMSDEFVSLLPGRASAPHPAAARVASLQTTSSSLGGTNAEGSAGDSPKASVVGD